MPFVLVRQQQVVGAEITTTVENIHGVIHVGGGTMRLQWRTSRETARVGREIRTDVELDPVAEVELPLSAVASVEVRTRWWNRFGIPGGAQLIIRAADLRAFESVAGAAGLVLAHPAELVIPVRHADGMAAREFAAESMLAIAELGSGESAGDRLEDGRRRLGER
jgi:hypothetical protein